jgi:hypothetical protein
MTEQPRPPSMLARLRSAPVPTPAILGAVLVITVFLEDGISPYGAARAVLIATLIGAIVWLFLWALLRSPDRAAIAGIFVVLALWNTPDWWKYLLAAALVAGVPFVIERLARRRLPWRTLAVASAIFSVALLITPLLTWAGWGGPSLLVADLGQGGGLDRLEHAAPPVSDGASGSASEAPDIYLMLLDEHSRQDTLQRDFGADDSAFLAGLRQRGFDVSSASHSNYDSTEWTLASMLQMRYLDDIPSIETALARGQPIDSVMRELSNDNPVFDTLRSHGYTVVTTTPWFEHTSIRRSDVLVDAGLLNEFEMQILMDTTVGRIIDRIAPSSWLGDQFRDSVTANFGAAARIAATPSPAPRFVFVHVPAPHEPYVFGADGSPQPLGLMDMFGPYAGSPEQLAAKRAAYASEVTWVDQQALAAVDAILASARRPTAIIVFGDHGSRLPVLQDYVTGNAARVSNLFAARTPGKPGLFGDSPTLVNLFPTLLDAYLGTDFPTLHDLAWDYYPHEVEVPLPTSGP